MVLDLFMLGFGCGMLFMLLLNSDSPKKNAVYNRSKK